MGILVLSGGPPIVAGIPATGNLLQVVPEAGVTYTRAYRTDVHVSQNGLEHRHTLSGHAREEVELTFVPTDEATFRALRRLRTWNPVDEFLVPIPWEAAPCTANVTSVSVAIDATNTDWGTTFNRVLVEGPAGQYYTAVIQEVTGSGAGTVLRLDVSPPGTWPASASHVMPIRPFRLQDQSPVGRYQVGAGQWRAKFYQSRVNPSAVTILSALPTFGGLSVLDRRPVLEGLGAEDRPRGPVTVTDVGNAAPTVEWSRAAVGAGIYRSHTYFVEGALDYQYFRGFGQTVKGQQKAFLLPTFRDDLPVVGVAGADITVDDGGDYVNYWFNSAAHRRVMILAANGAVEYHSVSSAVIVSNQSKLTLNSSVSAASVAVTSFLETVRLAKDDLTFTFNEACRGKIELEFMVVQQ